MKRLPRRIAKRISWVLIALALCAALGPALFPAARGALWTVCAVSLAALLTLSLTALRCPECGCLTRLEDKFCPQCGKKLEEAA